MKTIQQHYTIHAPIKEVWQALVNPEYIDEWGAGPAIMNDRVGTEFSLWGGDIHGKNIEVIPQQKLVQEWYGGDWDEPSVATFTLTQEGDTVRVDFLHEHVPDEEAKDIEDGWKAYYLGPLKEYLEEKGE